MLPKLRTISVNAAEGGYVLSDPTGASDAAIWLSEGAMAIASLLDGERALPDLRDHILEVAGLEVPLERLQEIVDALTGAGFLDTDETRARVAELERGYLAQPARPMALAGHSFPRDRDGFLELVDGFRAAAPEVPGSGPLRGLVLPHLELRRVPEVYGAALAALAQTPAPERVLIVGVAHSPIAEMAAALPLSLDTPLGRLPVDAEALEKLAAGLPFPLHNSPLSFRHEHSIEFPAALLHAVWPEAEFQVIPLVVAGVSDAEALAPLVSAIANLARTHPFFPVASVDLSHVGARFGDPALDDLLAAATGDLDRAYLTAIAERGFGRAFEGVTGSGNPTRIDAYASVHALHEVLDGAGEVLAYRLSLEPETGSAVGAGAVAFR